jgi:hypothetical protein
MCALACAPSEPDACSRTRSSWGGRARRPTRSLNRGARYGPAYTPFVTQGVVASGFFRWSAAAAARRLARRPLGLRPEQHCLGEPHHRSSRRAAAGAGRPRRSCRPESSGPGPLRSHTAWQPGSSPRVPPMPLSSASVSGCCTTAAYFVAVPSGAVDSDAADGRMSSRGGAQPGGHRSGAPPSSSAHPAAPSRRSPIRQANQAKHSSAPFRRA